MSKWRVTFQFRHGDVEVIVAEASDCEAAIATARCQEVGAPVPDFIPATAVEITHGGARSGSGNRVRKRLVKERRDIKKQIRWTRSEWEQIERDAKAAGMQTFDYQRFKILGNAE